MKLMYPLARSILFRLDPEAAHHLVEQTLARAARLSALRAAVAAAFHASAGPPVRAFGLEFPNPVGLAAGWDKDGEAWWGIAALGFGHVEVGTVTPRAQPGNPKPRVFRLVEQESLINRMGFPGKGAQWVQQQLERIPDRGDLVLGVNIGKQKTTPLEDAADDYLFLMEVFASSADYLTVNISSPNTPGLRRLQHAETLRPLLDALRQKKRDLEDDLGRRVPVLIKLSPDLDEDGIRGAVDAVVGAGMDGLIVTNTTISRPGLEGIGKAGEDGGLSGRALKELSMEVLEKVLEHLDGSLPVISAGGIMSPDDARLRLDAGACLVQLFTGLIYAGPTLVRDILGELRAEREGEC